MSIKFMLLAIMQQTLENLQNMYVAIAYTEGETSEVANVSVVCAHKPSFLMLDHIKFCWFSSSAFSRLSVTGLPSDCNEVMPGWSLLIF